MSVATQRRAQTSAPTDGSRTITLRDAQPRPEDADASDGGISPSTGGLSTTAIGVLKLRGAQRRTRQRVAWGADVVDNEGCGKKKSKICCIYHKPRRFDESSSDSESSPASGSGSDSEGSDRARPSRRRCHHASYGHNSTLRRQGQGGSMQELGRPDSDSDVNAYERTPKRNA